MPLSNPFIWKTITGLKRINVWLKCTKIYKVIEKLELKISFNFIGMIMNIYMCVRACVCACVRVCVCMCMRACVCTLLDIEIREQQGLGIEKYSFLQ